MVNPAILTVEEDAAALQRIEQELLDGYTRRYRVVCLTSPEEALALLEQWAADDEPVALVLAGQQLDGMTGGEFLAQVRRMHRHAKRAVLIDWGALGDRDIGRALADAMAQGDFDHYLLRPASPPDERFSQTVSGFLLEWAEAQRIAPHTIHVVGESWSGRAYELRHVLGRCAMPHSFSLADSERDAASSSARTSEPTPPSRSSSSRTGSSSRTRATPTSPAHPARRSSRPRATSTW